MQKNAFFVSIDVQLGSESDAAPKMSTTFKLEGLSAAHAHDVSVELVKFSAALGAVARKHVD